jgi:hypothetical protein
VPNREEASNTILTNYFYRALTMMKKLPKREEAILKVTHA